MEFKDKWVKFANEMTKAVIKDKTYHRASLKKLEKWYDKEYKDRGKDFGVPIEAYIDFPYYLDMPLRCVTSSGYPLNFKALDVACGQGYLLEILHAFFDVECYGIEISKEAIKICNQREIEATIRKCPAEQIGFPSKVFRYVTCIGSLEHFNNIDKSLQEMHRVGKNNCQYCILVPNKSSWWHNTTEQQEINETMYSLRGWSKIFKTNGFKIDKIHRDRWHIKKPQSILKMILNYLTPKRYFHSLVFILRKSDGKYKSNIFN